MTVFTPLPVPVIEENLKEQDALTDEQHEKYSEVLKHFNRDDYKLPGEEKGELMDEEKFWLVSSRSLRSL